MTRLVVLVVALALLSSCGPALPADTSSAPAGATATPSAEVAIAYAARARACSDVRFVRWIDFRTIALEGCGQSMIYMWRDGWADVSPDATQTPHGSPGGAVHVRGYYRRDGTYVHPHTRDRPR